MSEMTTQPAVLLPVPRQARYLSFRLNTDVTPEVSKDALRVLTIDDRCVVGIGEPVARHWGRELQGLKPFPALSGPGVDIPSTQQALWCWLKGDDRGELVHRTREIVGVLDKAFHLEQIVDAFKFGNEELGLDLTGYEDGTENPTGDDAVNAAIVDDQGPGMDGSSFVAVQQWVHDLDAFESMPLQEQDHIIGRRKSDNEEIEDAPESAHVKRVEQESFEPAAFVLRRSMPWAEGEKAGLLFVAFGKSLDAFETQLNRMAGLEDGIADALFRFSKPVTGGYYWCPPVQSGQLDLNALDI
jgi:putative iron-dependent peroxidase